MILKNENYLILIFFSILNYYNIYYMEDQLIIIQSGRKLNKVKLQFNCLINNKGINIVIPSYNHNGALKEKIYDDEDEYIFGKLFMTWNKVTQNLKGSFLHAFYIYPNNYPKLTTSVEKETFKGMGILMLCIALSMGLRRGYIKKDTNIYLEADGGLCPDPNNMLKNRNKILDIVKNKYKYDLKELNEDYAYDDEGLYYWYCLCVGNEKLVNYYKTLGFKVIDDDRCRGVLMKSTIKEVFNKCDNVYRKKPSTKK